MNWKDGISLKAGMSKEILSFQQATIPLLAVRRHPQAIPE